MKVATCRQGMCAWARALTATCSAADGRFACAFARGVGTVQIDVRLYRYPAAAAAAAAAANQSIITLRRPTFTSTPRPHAHLGEERRRQIAR
ncbi:hypothetical protein DM02DRAFT_348568 [Periconia macrospinosa]|uniref:Uncharacterized protein n=1 Tax=Periconia macrospinosa TaxID=97972 RepID=A0A2V1DTE5_9PLEO|nr:hypothetical protein DM02DRAFT_348568 [Periconia macrospinosa]